MLNIHFDVHVLQEKRIYMTLEQAIWAFHIVIVMDKNNTVKYRVLIDVLKSPPIIKEAEGNLSET